MGESSLRPMPKSFYRRPPEEVARDLLGRYLVRRTEGGRRVLRIVETEAYLGSRDRASHAFGGRRTRRNRSLFLSGGHAYVYLIYGVHHCLNAVTGEGGEGDAVLIRAGEPIQGGESMARRRGLEREPRPGEIAGGPGKLCQALEIDLGFDGRPLDRGELVIAAGAPVEPRRIAVGPRVGVDGAGEAAAWPLRFALRDSPHVSRPRPA